MEFYLVNEKRNNFRQYAGGASDLAPYDAKSYSPPEPTDQYLTLDYVAGGTGKGDTTDGGGPSVGTSFRKDLIDLLCKNTTIGQENCSEESPKSPSLNLIVFVTMSAANTASVKIVNRDVNNVRVRDAKTDVFIFDRLVNSVLPSTSYRFNFKMKFIFDGTTYPFEINGKDLKIKGFKQGNWRYGLGMTDIKIPDDLWRQWNNAEGVIEGVMTLTLRLDYSAVNKLYLGRIQTNHFNEWPKKMLNDGFGSDLVILVGGEKDKEKGIKCHKFVLSDRSEVFKTMFQTGMSEAKDNTLEIVDMTEAGVRALLQFMYCWDLEMASKSCDIAFELLQAGHKYLMDDLEKAMTDIFMGMTFEWFSVDLAVKLLLFSKKGDEDKLGKLEKRSLEVLKWNSLKSGSLMASEEFRRLYLEYPQTALELAESFLKI